MIEGRQYDFSYKRLVDEIVRRLESIGENRQCICECGKSAENNELLDTGKPVKQNVIPAGDLALGIAFKYRCR